jgi:hypothetical protein
MLPLYTFTQTSDQWEFPREKLHFRQKLGDGAFGEVWRAVAQSMSNGRDSTVVAVKMVKGIEQYICMIFLYYYSHGIRLQKNVICISCNGVKDSSHCIYGEVNGESVFIVNELIIIIMVIISQRNI